MAAEGARRMATYMAIFRIGTKRAPRSARRSAMADAAADAVRVLLTSRDPAALAAANATLAEVASDPRGWPVAFALASAPDAHAAFFGLNLLLAKARAQRLPDDDADALYAWLLAQLAAASKPPQLLIDRMCTLLACLAAASGGDAVAELVEEALGMDESLALCALGSLAEEALHRGTALEYGVTAALQEAADSVVAFASRAAARGNAAQAFECLARWCRAGVTLAHEDASVAPLLPALVAAAGSPDGDERAAEAAAAVLEDLLEAVDPLPGRSEAVAHVAHGMGAAWAALAASVDGFATARGRAALRVAAALAGPEAAWLAAALAREEAAASACLRCLLAAVGSAPPDGAAAAALAPWTQLAHAPAQRWPPAAREQLFAALLDALLRRAAAAAAGGADALEAEAEASLLEGPGAAAAAAAAQALGPAALAAALLPRAASGDAAAAEAAFWCAAAVGDEHGTLQDADASQLAAALASTAAAAQAMPPRCVGAAADAMRALATPLAAAGAGALRDGAAIALRALGMQQAAERGTAALEAICVAAACAPATALALMPLAPACEAAAAAVPLPDIAARVTGALAAVAAALPLAEAVSAMCALQQPSLVRLRASLEARNAAAAGEALAALAAWADRGGAGILTRTGAPPEAAAALQSSWDAADAAAAAAGADARIAAAASSIWQSLAIAQSWNDDAAVVRAANSAAALWAAHATPRAAECLESLLCLYIPPMQPPAALAGAICAAALTAPALAAAGAAAGDAAAALFTLCGEARRADAAMLAGPPMGALLTAALALAPTREEVPARAALRFLAVAFSADAEQPPDPRAVAQAPQALRVCVAAAAETSPPPLMPDVADCIRAAYSSMPPEQAAAALAAALEGRHAGASQALARGAARLPPHSVSRYASMVAAFAGVCRGETALDAMDAY